NPRNSLVGVDVTLLVNGEPQTAKTDAAGHARFDNLPVGATVVAKTKDSEGNETESEQFSVPDENGAHVMISTKPFEPVQGGGEGGAPFAPFANGGGGGM